MKKLTNKHRFYLLVAGTLVALLLAYNMAISKTLELKKGCNKIEDELNAAGYAPARIAALNKKLAKIESLYGSDFEDLDKLQEKLLNHISQSCKQYELTLIELPSVHEFAQSDYVVKTFKIVVEGNYTNILKFIYDLEFKPALGRLASVKFSTETDYRYKNKKLFAQIIIQNIEL